ncbi:MAG: hypothetical protein M0R40_06805 [Firmicutes bacterium]|nr:hypothetical protein [Bacillota bacterium]
MKLNEIIDFAKKQGYISAKSLGKWNGYDIYEPIYNEDGVSFIGVPLLILVQDKEIRMSTVDEAFEHLDSLE